MILLILAVIFVLLNGWLVTRPTRTWVWITKPAVMVLLIGWALSRSSFPDFLSAPGTFPLVWFLLGLVCSLAGDIFLMLGTRYLPWGVGAFSLTHLFYILGFGQIPPRAGSLASGRRAGCFCAHHLWVFDYPDIPRTGNPLTARSKGPSRAVPAAGLADAVFGPAELVRLPLGGQRLAPRGVRGGAVLSLGRVERLAALHQAAGEGRGHYHGNLPPGADRAGGGCRAAVYGVKVNGLNYPTSSTSMIYYFIE